MSAFEIVTLSVTLIAAALSLTPYFRVSRVLADLGRQGVTWFERDEEREIAERPLEDAVDSPIPRRPLRGRY